MIPETLTSLDGMLSPQSYGLLESFESRRTEIDQTGGDDELDYYDDCLEMFPGEAGELY